MVDLEKPRRVGLLLAAAAVAVALLGSASWTKPVLPSLETTELDVRPHAVDAIKPGTEVTDRAPEGWTHLIVKTRTQIGPDSLSKVSATTLRMTSMLFTAMLASVERRAEGGAAPYRLARVAVGVGTAVKGRDIVLSSETQKALGANMGLIDRTVLSGGEAQLEEMSCVARSPSMMILDAPSFMFYGNKHHTVVMRYALLVDMQSGTFSSLVWPLQKERPVGAVPLGPVEWLDPNLMQDCALHVDLDEYSFGFPTKKAFAVRGPPPGRRKLHPSEPLQRLLATAVPLAPDTALAIEEELRQLMADYRKR